MYSHIQHKLAAVKISFTAEVLEVVEGGVVKAFLELDGAIAATGSPIWIGVSTVDGSAMGMFET
jgi:hypothetical protein